MKYGRVTSIIFLGLYAANVVAEPMQSLDEIILTAKDFAYQEAQLASNSDNVRISHGDLDPRLRLPKCETPLLAFNPPGSKIRGNTTVGIKCDSPKPWSIYVPIRIAVYEAVVVVNKPLRRGDLILKADVDIREIDTSQLRGVPYQAIERVIGSKTKTNLNAGTIIDSEKVCLVCKGDTVSITASASQIAVVMSGVALADGTEGDAIRVQNSSSRRILEARVVNNNTVVVGI